MKNGLGLILNAFLLLCGFAFISLHGDPGLYKWIARLLGFLFLLPSLIYVGMVCLLNRKERDKTQNLGITPAVGGMCFGIVLMSKPLLFEDVLSIIFAVLVIVLGLFHLLYLKLASRRVVVHDWYYVMPFMILLGGIVCLFFLDKSRQSWAILITGIAMVLYTITSLIEYVAERHAKPVDDGSGSTDSTSLVHHTD